MVRVRFAPSPTGFLHVGNLRAALYNELFARKNGGVFVVRMEDTDRTRFVEGSVENTLRTLAWAGITPDEGPYLDANGALKERGDYGPYVQSQRLALYREKLDELIKKGAAYPCFCTAERLDEMRKNQETMRLPVMYDRHCAHLSPEEGTARIAAGEAHVYRMLVPDGVTEFKDAIRGDVSFNNSVVDDQVLLKSDGFPTYHLANVVDDHEMAITHVIRAEEWLSSTPKHLILYKAFGWQAPVFAHVPLILNEDRSKLSKRQGDVAVEDYRRKGYLPAALVNFIALLGWNPTGDREKYSKDELIAAFDLAAINRAGAVFNREKLDWLNGEYLKALDTEALYAAALPFLEESGCISITHAGHFGKDGAPLSKERISRALALEQSRVKTLAEFPAAVENILCTLPELKADMLPWKKSTAPAALDRLTMVRTSLADWTLGDVAQIEAAMLALIAKNGWTNGEVLWPLRVALSGKEKSPSPFELIWALGKELALARIDHAIAILKSNADAPASPPTA